MNKRERAVFDNLFELSTDIEPVHNSRHAAAVVRKGIIYGIGINSTKTDPMQQRYCKLHNAGYMHAEMSAIKRTTTHLRTDDLSGHTIIVVRSKYNEAQKDVLGNSKPCEACQQAIEAHGIIRLIYSLNDGYKIEKRVRL